MIEKEFVPYQESLELKELGFDEPCFAIYEDKKWQLVEFKNSISYELCLKTDTFPAPTFSKCFRWFREKHDISYSIDWMSRKIGYYSGYIVHFRGINGKSLNQENFIVLNDELPRSGYGVYKTYEEAELECLKKLIKIIKQKT